MDQIDSQRCRQVADLLKNLAHTERLMILCYLSIDKRNVNELTQLTGCSQSAVSQFLNKMRLQGIVDYQKEGRFVNYYISDDRVARLISSLHEIYG